MKVTRDRKVTLKWHEDVLYVWPDNVISQISVRHGRVNGPLGQRVFVQATGWAILGRMTHSMRQLLMDGFVMCVPVAGLFNGLTL